MTPDLGNFLLGAMVVLPLVLWQRRQRRRGRITDNPVSRFLDRHEMVSLALIYVAPAVGIIALVWAAHLVKAVL